MTIPRICLAFALAMLSVLAFSASASAQATRTWVSGVGDDANPCSRTAPCKTFAGAISKTAANGEINCIDPGGFGAVTITKAITLACEYTEGGVLVASTNGIIVNVPADTAVTLRGLDILANATGLVGVNIVQGGIVRIDDCNITGFAAGSAWGVQLATTDPSALAAQLFISGSQIINNGAGTTTGGGINIAPQSGSGSVRVVITDSRVDSNVNGVTADASAGSGTIRLTVTGSSMSGNIGNGVGIKSAGTSNEALIDGSTAVNNGRPGIPGAGFRSTGAGAVIRLANDNATGNVVGLAATSGGQILSYGNNHVDGNVTDGTPTGTIAQK